MIYHCNPINLKELIKKRSFKPTKAYFNSLLLYNGLKEGCEGADTPYLSHAPRLQSKSLEVIVHFIHSTDLR